ncbi:MAG: hypothetical protein P8180_11135 [Gammaproteobacteria bacterium]
MPAAGGVVRSAYYDWRARPGQVIAPEELAVRRRMKALFKASRDSLGRRTLERKLREEASRLAGIGPGA